jgi:phytoene dehydrogenase-like protein
MKNTLSGKNIVIIGSGVGGLSAGILLALENYEVTVVEKNPLPGGLMRSYNRAGMDCPVGVHYVGALGEKEPLGMLFHALGLSVHELFSPMGQSGIIDRYIFDDFTFDLPASLDGLEAALKDFSPEDSAAVDAIMRDLRDISQRFANPAFLISQSDPFRNMDDFQSMGERLNKIGASAKLRSVLAVPCNLIGVPLDDCPVIFHHMVLASYMFSSWKLKEGGTRMTDVLVRRLQEKGGELLLNRIVKKISVAQSKVTGVILESGEHIPADAIVRFTPKCC